ncbi:hypothetical protein J2X65_004003 [Ancylobacter sp. 3268]|uniref:hypothetical protein n=1 Tax=Ancylobacter sp. 3268 TaxID=2817752 RepID=UPI002856C8CA|nr:hypothetical protein [Ancylobacter sp. 3268]MDR6954627.1 hypothetical protein [Ancylobacter sp. 3268]
MVTPAKLEQGSREWFEMVGTVVCRALNRAAPRDVVDWTLVERYADGRPMPDGLIQGIRFDIRDGRATFRVGAGPDERGDATIEVTVAAARALNLLHSDDPRFDSAREDAVETGAMRVEGDLSPIATALVETHDYIVDRTA